MKKSRLGHLLLWLWGLTLVSCGQAPDSSPKAKRSTDDATANQKYGGSSPDASYRKVLEALKLTDDAASPSDLISDEDYRNKLQASMLREIDEISCQNIFVQDGTSADPKTHVSTYLVQYTIAKYQQGFHALVTIPQDAGNYPAMLYAPSGFEIPYRGDELKTLLGRNIEKLVTITPLLGDEPFQFNGKIYQDAAVGSAYLGDVDRMYGLALCLQNNHTTMMFDGRSLGSLLQLSKNDLPGFRMIGSGSGRGGLVASLAIARSGAALLGSVAEATKWARFDCGVFTNPLQTFYGGEARLALAALIRGNTEETKYIKIPGLRQLRYEVFHGYRKGTLTAEDVAFQLAKRDAYINAPFVNMALKDFTQATNDKGLHAGGLLLMHGSARSDFSINTSRIYANVASTVNFFASEITNGTNILYREFDEALQDEAQSYKSIFSERFLQGAGKKIDDFNIFVTDDLKDQDKQYRWVIRGSAYPESLDKTPADTMNQFLSASCGLK